MFATNVFGLVDITNRVVSLMKAQASGDIVNIASTSGMKGAAGATAYAGSKWAVRGISQCWQAELRPLGIRVTCVCPSEVQTNFGGRTGRNNPNKLYAADIAATIMAAIDMPRRVLWPELAVFANNPWKEDSHALLARRLRLDADVTGLDDQVVAVEDHGHGALGL